MFDLSEKCKSVIKPLVLLIIVMNCLVSFSSLSDGDDKTYGGFACLEKGQETGDFNRSMYRITRVNNKGTGILLCPIIRDVIYSDSNISGILIYVNTYRTENAGPMRISVKKLSASGALLQSETEYALTGHDEVGFLLQYEKDFGYYVLEVKMDVNKSKDYSKVFSYTVKEY